MTKAFLFLPLLLLGCASKPKPVNQAAHIPNPRCDAATLCVDMTSAIYVIQEGPVKVTPEQWQAAQGLYMWDIEASGKGFEVVDWDYLVTKVFKCRYEGRPVDCHGVMHADQGKIILDEGEVSMMDTFLPSGSISHVTREQWQAAQDLYYGVICADKMHCEPVMTGPPLDRFPPEHGTTIYENVYVPTGPEKFETFPPSGYETHKGKPLVINQSAVNSPGSNIISGGNITINGKKQPPSGDAK